MKSGVQPKQGTAMESNWAVYRQDDNGNKYLVEKGLTRDAAEKLAAELESHGHKQLYWATNESAA